MIEEYAEYFDESSAKELLELILSYLENPIEARKSNPRILSPMLRIEFRERDQLQNMSTSYRNFWHEIFYSLLWWELDHRAQHPANTKVSIFQETRAKSMRIRLDELGVASDKNLEVPYLLIVATIAFQDERKTEVELKYHLLQDTCVNWLSDGQGGPPKIILDFTTNKIFEICLKLSSEESLRELLLSKTSLRAKHLARRLISN